MTATFASAEQIVQLRRHRLDALVEFAVGLAATQAQFALNLFDRQPIDAAVGEHGVDARRIAMRRGLWAQTFDAIQEDAAQILHMGQPIPRCFARPGRRQ